MTFNATSSLPAEKLPTADSTATATHGFSRTLVQLLATFFSVVAIDVVVGSLLVGKFRLWFPQWIDPSWSSNPKSLVIYSQSYASGIFLIPVLAWAVYRHFVARRWRTLYWLLSATILGIIVVWKGDLMLTYGKQREAVAWAALTAFLWQIFSLADGLLDRAERIHPLSMLRKLSLGVAAFFLIMAVLDPLVQVGIHHHPWNDPGLLVEVFFFVPAGASLAWLANKLRGASTTSNRAAELGVQRTS